MPGTASSLHTLPGSEMRANTASKSEDACVPALHQGQPSKHRSDLLNQVQDVPSHSICNMLVQRIPPHPARTSASQPAPPPLLRTWPADFWSRTVANRLDRRTPAECQTSFPRSGNHFRGLNLPCIKSPSPICISTPVVGRSSAGTGCTWRFLPGRDSLCVHSPGTGAPQRYRYRRRTHRRISGEAQGQSTTEARDAILVRSAYRDGQGSDSHRQKTAGDVCFFGPSDYRGAGLPFWQM
jgi:hypothetical protein